MPIRNRCLYKRKQTDDMPNKLYPSTACFTSLGSYFSFEYSDEWPSGLQNVVAGEAIHDHDFAKAVDAANRYKYQNKNKIRHLSAI